MDQYKPGTQDWLNQVLCGDALEQLRILPDEVVDAVVTSPPYFQQRDYGGVQQLGTESTLEEYVQRLVDIFAECHRVMKPSGTLWIVLGDKYRKGKQLGLPWRVTLALIDTGWILRSDIIWHKPNAMPSAVKTRPTTDHEYVFLLTKASQYYYDADAIREPHVTFTDKSRMRGGRKHFHQRDSTPEQGKNGGHPNLHNGRWDQAFHPKGRNKRTVWSIPLSKFREAHFAVFPEPLVETCVLAGCPPHGVVLDPFLGSGTTAVVAQRLERNYIGIDCVSEYCEMARKRISDARVSDGRTIGASRGSCEHGARIMTFRVNGRSASIGSNNPGMANVLLGDGSVRQISNHLDSETLRNLIQPADGNTVGEF